MPEMDDKVGTSDKKVPEGGKKKGALNKYKWWIVGGLAVIAVLVFYFTSKSKSGSANQSTQAGIDPNTGLPIGGGGGVRFRILFAGRLCRRIIIAAAGTGIRADLSQRISVQ